MPKLKMRPIGGCISPGENDPVCSSSFNTSKHIQWMPKQYTGPVDLEMYIDEGILQGFLNNEKKYGWLLESPGYNADTIEILRTNIELVKQHYHKIFTTQIDLVELGEPFTYCLSNAAPWTLLPNRTNHPKTKLVSMLVSNNHVLPGHRFRWNYMETNREYLDVFGKGHKPVEHTDEAYLDYMFTVSMENDINDAYFTERLTSPMTTYTVPIYRGSRAVVENYFNPKGVLFYDEINLQDLTSDLYESMLPYVEENYHIACSFPVADDYIFENYIINIK